MSSSWENTDMFRYGLCFKEHSTECEGVKDVRRSSGFRPFLSAYRYLNKKIQVSFQSGVHCLGRGIH